LDGHSAAALAFTRSAGRAGHWVAVGANQGIFAAAKLSRYCQSSFDYPVSTDNATAFVDRLLEFVATQSIDLVVPITDWTLLPLSEQRSRLYGSCRFALPPDAAVKTASDKYQTVEVARSLGIGVPATRLAHSPDDLRDLRGMDFPVVVKDRSSVRWVNGQAIFGSVTYAYGKEDLECKVMDRLRAAGDVLIQEFVSGKGIGFSCFAAPDGVYAPFAWERIREVDPRGSASSCRKSIALDDHFADLSGRLIRAIGFQGVAMVEYKQARQGPPVIMEINGRPWGSIALPIANGIDYPLYLIDWYLNGTLPPKRIDYRPGTVCRRIVGELTHLNNVRWGKPDRWPGEYPTFWSTLAKIAVPWYPGMHYDDLWLSDLRPGLAEIEHWFRVRLQRQIRNVKDDAQPGQ
jgi:predicted ATP-grasp superfamily ATP-dependent carboligase